MIEYSRDDLTAICEQSFTPQDKWRDRDSSSAHRQLGEAYALLKSGCDYKVLREGMLETDKDTIWLEITHRGFSDFEDGSEPSYKDNFYLPTQARLDDRKGDDWY
ncbi:MAG TPA: hypothetical protein PK911_05125 [Candidatus Saccharibacteria bacterium]|nr:hypothetical protein [Candidatus Saccharibacteria bacterium]